MTSNVHHLLHMGKVVEHLGPLWSHSTFVFEGGNGKVLKSVNAAKGVPLQIIERAVLAQELDCLLTIMPLRENVLGLCKDMVGYAKMANFSESAGTCFLGRPKVVSLNEDEKASLALVLNEVPEKAAEYNRIIVKGMVCNSTSYNRAHRSDSSAVVTETGDFRKIVRILKFSDGSCFLICRKIPLVAHPSTKMPPHILECFLSPLSALCAVAPADIAEVCLYIDFAHEETSFICYLPNQIERD